MLREVLVLNKSWQPVGVISLKRAMRKIRGVYADGTPKARILDPSRDFRLFTWSDWADKINAPQDGEDVIRTAENAYRIPEIILLTKYDKVRPQPTNFSRRAILRRDGNQCMYCGCKPGTKELSLDHILPRCQGGLTTWENVCTACIGCNSRKAGRTMAQAGMRFFHPDYKPKRPKFDLLCGKRRCKSWEEVLDESYWSTTLDNDMGE